MVLCKSQSAALRADSEAVQPEKVVSSQQPALIGGSVMKNKAHAVLGASTELRGTSPEKDITTKLTKLFHSTIYLSR
jgi:hypothetical protein